MCVSGHWLVVTFHLGVSTPGIRLYRLPDLTPIQDLNYSDVGHPSCRSDGRFYVPAGGMLPELEISPQGNLTIRRDITTGEGDIITAVGLGPQTDQLCIGVVSLVTTTPALYIIHLVSGNITTRVNVSDQFGCFPDSVAILSTGQILLTSARIYIQSQYISVLYQTISHQPLILRNTTWDRHISMAYKENFLATTTGFQGGIDVLDSQGHVVHTIEYNYGFFTSDLAVWQDSILLLDANGALLWLSPV